jgi:hypothetical protein
MTLRAAAQSIGVSSTHDVPSIPEEPVSYTNPLRGDLRTFRDCRGIRFRGRRWAADCWEMAEVLTYVHDRDVTDRCPDLIFRGNELPRSR